MMQFQSMETAPRDGKEIILKTKIGIISAHYAPIERSYSSAGEDEWGPCWIAYDDAIEFEIEWSEQGEFCPDILAWASMPEDWQELPEGFK